MVSRKGVCKNYMDEISLQRKKSGIYISMEAAEEADLDCVEVQIL